jgi:hypothetical protein
VNAPTAIVMVVGMLAHTLNALYYADLVVGNYHVALKEDAAADKNK